MTLEPIKKSQQMQLIAKQQKTLDLANSIVSKECNLSILEMNLKIDDTLNKPVIRSVFKGKLAEVSFAVVNVLCTRFINSFAFTSKLTSEQIEMLTVDTLEAFGYESLEDIVLFFKMARSGKFGNTKRSVDSNLIYGEWFPMYMEKKAIAREKAYSIKKSEITKNDTSVELVKEVYKKHYDSKELEAKKQAAKRFVDKVCENFDKEMLENTIKEWEKDPKKKYYTDLLKKKRRVIRK